MTPDIALTLFLLAVVVVLFSTEWLPFDLAALLGLCGLVISELLSVDKALSGFANEIIVTLACVFVISGTLARSGLTQETAKLILKLARGKALLTPVLMTVAATLSAFFSNTSTTGMLIPTVLGLAKKTRQAASRLLMPLAFASILGGTCTLIGTSTNLASASLLARLGVEPFSLFEFTMVGILIAAIGIFYMSVVGYRFIPTRESADIFEDYDVQGYLSELLVDTDSPVIGSTLGSLRLKEDGITPLAIVRGDTKLSAHGNRRLRENDKVIVRASRDALLHSRNDPKLSIEAERTLTDQDIVSDEMGMSEVVVLPQSRIVGSSLKTLRFHSRYQIAVLAVYRRGQSYPAQIERTILRAGDVLLIQGSKRKLRELSLDPDLWIMRDIEDAPISTLKGLYAVGALSIAIVLTALGVVPVSIAFLLAGISLVVARCTTMEEAYLSIEWRLLVLIGSMSAFGMAMQETGTAEYVAESIVEVVSWLGVHATLAAFALLTVVLTQPMSNAAAALVLIPVAVSTAGAMGLDPRPFAVMVTLSASLSFITPLEPASLLVFGVGKYRFRDFALVGLPLTALVVGILVFVVPILWPP